MPQYEPLESERHPDVKFLGQLRNLDLYIDTRQPEVPRILGYDGKALTAWPLAHVMRVFLMAEGTR